MDTYYVQKEDYKKGMGKRLRKYRLQSSLTQEKMAEILDVSLKHYSEVERGITGLSVEKLIFLSNFFGISVDYLLKGEKDKDILPFVLIDVYESCPEENRTLLLDMLKSLNKLLHSSPDAAE
ncbi:MAG: helix-turn-helix transcriptional regulator [Lachnospiraceae bacterium]|jgi:transcriptional regulator with XRE-family HTH domain|nr:helix-turn-helix transcriptional regulator [Lachnospiraceae bacterium]